jgi:hypothetical protein
LAALHPVSLLFAKRKGPERNLEVARYRNRSFGVVFDLGLDFNIIRTRPVGSGPGRVNKKVLDDELAPLNLSKSTCFLPGKEKEISQQFVMKILVMNSF